MKFASLRFSEWFKLTFLFILVGAVGAIARSFYLPTWRLSDVVYALADALIVSCVIGTLLELFSAKILIERVTDNLVEKLVGRGFLGSFNPMFRRSQKLHLLEKSIAKHILFRKLTEMTNYALKSR